MTLHLDAVCFAARRPAVVARFWSGLLGLDTLRPAGDAGYRIRFVPAEEPKAGRNRAHFDLPSETAEEQRRTVARALELGGRHIDVGQLPEEEHVVLADPEGNEFCVIEAGNQFLAGCGPVGALAGEGTAAVGYFWSAALGWPLVWDQDEETAIQSPAGGSKFTWGGPPLMPRTGRDRVWFDLAIGPGGDVEAEVARLLALGATRTATGLADPDGNEFRINGWPNGH